MTLAEELDAYAGALARGEILAGRLHILAGARHLRDRAREAQRDPAFPYYFHEEHARRILTFAGQLRHYKGKWAGQPIVLTPIQRFRLASVFGWRHRETHRRRFRVAYNELPRKQGKTLEAAIVALYCVFFDHENAAEGYCVATKLAQAKLVFNDAGRLAKRAPELRKRLVFRANSIYSERTLSTLQPLGADSDTLDGLSPSLVVNDEYHAHKNRKLLDVIETATGAREQPLDFQITTAGRDPFSPCGTQHEYARKVLERVLEDETFFALICHADPEDDWQDERTWRKANPHYGISINPDDLAALARMARAVPEKAAAFKQKRLGLWVNDDATWLSVDGWRAGQSTRSRAELEAALAHEPCYIGVDLASKLDLLALVLLFPPAAGRPRWTMIVRAWTPKDTLAARAHKDQAPYQVWVDQGFLEDAPGTAVSHRVVIEALLEARERFDLERIGFDPWHADQLAKDLVDDHGFADDQVLAVPQTYAGMSAGCKTLEAEVLAGNVDAGGSPLALWCASNVVVQRDGKDNIFPVKKRSKGRIDPIVAAAIAFNLHQRFGAGGSVYDEPGQSLVL